MGQLTQRVQARYLIAFGWIGLAFGMYVSSRQMDLLVSFKVAAWLRVLQAVPMGFLFVPLTLAGYIGLPSEKTNAAAGLMNFMRNIGQSVGTSAVTTIIARRTQFHQSVLAEHTSSAGFHAALQPLASRLTQAGIDPQGAQQQALGRLYGLLQSQAAALSYVEAYWLLAAAAAIMFFVSFLLKRNELGSRVRISVH